MSDDPNLSKVPRLNALDRTVDHHKDAPPVHRPILSSTLFALLTVGFGVANASEATQAPAAKPKALSYGKLPLHFELNRGQTAPEVDYLARGDGYVLYLTSGEAVLSLRQNAPSQPGQVPDPKAVGLADSSPAQEAVLRMKLVGAETKPTPAGLEVLPGRTNYFRGQDPSKWLSDIPSFAKVRYSNVYPGIDVVYYGNQRQLEYDFVVAPGISPSVIAMQFKGADHLRLDENGDLLVALGEQQLLLQKPFMYQQVAATRKEVRGSYRMDEQGRVSFDVGAYDRSRELVIDPVFVYSTYIGGTAYDSPEGVAVDSQGRAYLTGWTESADFPVTVGSGYGGGFVYGDAFVAKMNATGSALLWATYVGGTNVDRATGIALDANGNAYITGSTNSVDFPTTAGAFQEVIPGTSVQAAFVTKLDDSTGAIVWATYVGGTGFEGGQGIAVDSTGRAYIAGWTGSVDFPLTAGAYQAVLAYNSDAFFTVVKADGSGLDYSTYLGGDNPNDTAYAVAVDGDGNGYIAGETGWTVSVHFPTTPGSLKTTVGGSSDAFVAKFDPDESGAASLIYSTFLGGDDGGGNDRAYDIAVDGSGNAYVAGHTDSIDFPTTVGAYQSTVDSQLYAFVSKVSADGAALQWSTVFGDTDCGANAQGLALDAAGLVYITGYAGCQIVNNFPVKNAAYLQPIQGNGGVCSDISGCTDVYVAKLDPSLSDGASLLWSTFLGGGESEYPGGIAVDSAGDAYVVGSTASNSTSFPLTIGAFDTVLTGSGDGFVTKIGAGSPAEPTTTVVSIQTASPQYSDEVTLRATVTPIEAGSFELTGLVYFYVGASAVDCSVALPGDAVGSDAILEADDGVAEIDYAIEEAASSPVVTGCFFSGTANFADSADDESLVVTKENATVTPGAGNLNAYPVISPTLYGGFTLTFTVRESGLPEPDANAGALAGEIGGAGLTVNLNGVGGNNKSAVCVDAAYAPGLPLLYTDQRVFTCTFTNVPVDAYEVVASVTGNYYVGSTYDVITVYNPAAGFVTGGGKFLYSESSPDRVNFGLVYNFIGKGKTVPKGNLLVIRRLANGDTCRLKSNGIGAAAVNGTTASFSGKGNYGCTRPDGSTYDGAGNQSILGWVQDNGQGSKATGPDRFWVNVSAANSNLAMPSPASTNARPLTGGNIQVPQGK